MTESAPEPGDFIVYKTAPPARFKVIHTTTSPDHSGRHKVFANRVMENGRLEADFESWFLFPFSAPYLSVEYAMRQNQLDLFGNEI